MATASAEQLLRSIWRAQVHVEPRALELAPASVRNSYEHLWQPWDVLVEELRHWPTGILKLWQESPRGHVIFTHLVSRYAPGPQPWRAEAIESVCYISVSELRQQPMQAILPLWEMADHLLGSNAIVEHPRLSQGAGVTPTLQEVGQRFLRIHALGYGHEALEIQTPEDYFAHTAWLYQHESQRLSVLDPLLVKLYRTTLFSDSFWN